MSSGVSHGRRRRGRVLSERSFFLVLLSCCCCVLIVPWIKYNSVRSMRDILGMDLPKSIEKDCTVKQEETNTVRIARPDEEKKLYKNPDIKLHSYYHRTELNNIQQSKTKLVQCHSQFEFLDIDEKDIFRENKKIIILLWTRYHGDRQWGPNWGPIGEHTCRHDDKNMIHQDCYVTHDKNRLEEADVVFFHCQDDVEQRKMLTRKRRPHQIFIVLCLESPSHRDFRFLDSIGMNASSTYRIDSDFPMYYGQVVPRSSAGKTHQIGWKNKRSVVWMVSNCKPTSHRELVVAELSKYIDVDIYGTCGKLRCMKDGPTCYKQLASRYKFYLAFENSLCRDYVAEKFFLALDMGMIPVVYGEANYTRHAPPHSYINARDFSSPAQLAEHLKQVGGNKTLYFEWKRSYEVKECDPVCGPCLAAARSTFTKMAGPLSSWWRDGICHNEFTLEWQKSW